MAYHRQAARNVTPYQREWKVMGSPEKQVTVRKRSRRKIENHTEHAGGLHSEDQMDNLAGASTRTASLLMRSIRGAIMMFAVPSPTSTQWEVGPAYLCLALPVLVATLAMTVVCLSNFGKALEPYLHRRQIEADTQLSVKTHAPAVHLERHYEYQPLSKPLKARIHVHQMWNMNVRPLNSPI
ncbi:hypothetical protein AC579_6358 [Pseudocercospora musae]|uniref:Uncharacterized protein n=1 Tax=Pseudocercospora musae TaxID=113226 RepID=A0A139H0X7_9PEZI|nr:hypothetical protein AC579_6358 [Pseudocercospora musae]